MCWTWHDRVPQGAFARLELLEGKLARAVLRGLGGSNPARLPGVEGAIPPSTVTNSGPFRESTGKHSIYPPKGLMEVRIMNGVHQLGYLIIGVSDLEGWRGLSSSVLGLELVPGDSRSTTYLRMDEHHHRIELRNGGSDDLEVIGWEVPDAATLHAVAQRLENAGVRVRSGTRDEADQRRVVELIGF